MAVALCVLTVPAISVAAAVRVALVDFSTDDNSYRSIAAAAQFASLVQIGLADEPGIEWVERSQIRLAQTEFALAEMKATGRISSIQRGRILGANWLVTGHFSTDDRERRTLSFQVIELEHADVIASETVSLPTGAGGETRFGAKQVEFAVISLRRLLANARSNELQATNQTRLAFLFLADTSRFSFGRGSPLLGRELAQALESRAATNRQIRLIRFPKAYQATEESEMLVDGIIETGQDTWRPTADIYVWGNYMVTNVSAAGRRESRLELELNLWNGGGRPTVLKESLPLARDGAVSASQTSDLLNRLGDRVLAAARRADTNQDSAAIRQEIAASILKAYVGMTGLGQSQLGLDDRERFVEAVHMLETACFFDPNSADARLLWITCRYGWWIDFGFHVKNQFWTEWRRNQAWKNYVERFGLSSGQAALPFPYQGNDAVCSSFLRSLEDVVEMFPQWHSSEEMALEDKWRREGTHTWLMEAEAHGFPKEMPHDLAFGWRKELESEHWNRLTKVVEYLKSGEWTPAEKQPPAILSHVVRRILSSNQTPLARLALLEGIWPVCAKCAQRFGKQWIVGAGELTTETERTIASLCAEAGKPEMADQLRAMLSQRRSSTGTNSVPVSPIDGPRSPTNTVAVAKPSVSASNEDYPAAIPKRFPSPVESTRTPAPPRGDSQMVTSPVWLKNPMPIFSMFRLYPPNVLPLEAKPEIQVIQFPPRYEVKVIRQMEFHDGQIWILAMDERSAPTSAATPDLAAERRDEVTRLWCLGSADTQPTLFKAEGLPSSINAMLFHQDQLWLGGDSAVALNLRDHSVRKFGIAEGLALREVEALAAAGVRVVAAGDSFDLSSFDPASAKWTRVSLPTAKLNHGTGSPYVLTGNAQWFGYVAGSALFHEFSRGTWTNLVPMNDSVCFAAESERFWAGGSHGLRCFNATRQVIQSWNSPSFLESPMIGLVGSGFFTGNAQIARNQLDQAEQRTLGCLKKLEDVRNRAHLARANRSEPVDPFQMAARIPGGIAALANDGEFLWLGANNYFGSYLLLLHKPSLSLVAGHTMGVRETISSLAVSEQDIWAGMAYGDNSLLRMRKAAFLAVPRSQWLSLAVTLEERRRIVQGMSKPAQALHAFYAGDDKRVVQLLGGLDPKSAGLQEMFLLAWSNDASGMDDPTQCRTWYDRIGARYPDSPWAKYALAAAKTNEVAHEARRVRAFALDRFDRNHDGVLDETEKRVMERDPAYAQAERKLNDQQTAIDMEQIVKRYDQNHDDQLELTELRQLREAIIMYSRARRELKNLNLPERKRPLDSLLSDQPPSAEEMLKRYDTNRDQKLTAAELSVLAEELRKN